MWNSHGTETLNGEQGQGSTGDSNFLCLEYNGRDDLAANETDSWERDHSCKSGKMTAMGTLGELTGLVISRGSKGDSLLSTLNKGNPLRGSCHNV